MILLFSILEKLRHCCTGLAVIDPLLLRCFLALSTAWIVTLILMPAFIALLKRHQWRQVIYQKSPERHQKKHGTPTMGGALIWIAVVCSVSLWGDLSNDYMLWGLLVSLGAALLGTVDDCLKIIRKHNRRGASARYKYAVQSGLAALFLGWLFLSHSEHSIKAASLGLVIPWSTHIWWGMPAFLGILLGYFTIVGSSNAVNLTDGLDGLAIVPIMLAITLLGGLAYLEGHSVGMARNWALPYQSGVGELSIYCSAILGAGMGFLWFNFYPARVFMGDVGSLGLGTALGVIAVALRQELSLFLMGGLFVTETLSVILQVASFRLTGRRIFRMAPLHHHFELKGWPETHIVIRFWLIAWALALIVVWLLLMRR